MKEIKLALIGRGISHSLSARLYKQYYTHYSYDLLDFESSKDLPSLAKLSQKYHGVNITSPYKDFYFGSDFPVNTINLFKAEKKAPEGVLTDKLAFDELWMKKFSNNKKTIFLIGDGVMGKMVADYFHSKQQNFFWLSRKKKNLESYSEFNNQACIIVNTCSRDFIFKESDNIHPKSFFWDFNYDFAPHLHLNEYCTYLDGKSLLELQAKHAVAFWNF